MAKTLSSQTLKKNNNAPTFSLKGTDNKLYSLEDFKSKSLLIVFICNHCPYVKARIGDSGSSTRQVSRIRITNSRDK